MLVLKFSSCCLQIRITIWFANRLQPTICIATATMHELSELFGLGRGRIGLFLCL